MKILIIGATGFIGSHVVPLLLCEGAEVHAASSKRIEYPPGVHGYCVDVLRGEATELIERIRPTHLLHLAWHVPPGKFWTANENVRWLRASLDLLEAFAAAGGQRWVGAGSCAEYDWSHGGVFRESDPIRPATLYGACKSSLQMTAQLFGQQLGVQVAWGRIFFPYGPGEAAARLVPSVVRSLLSSQPALCTEGRQVRDFIFVEDVARAFVALLKASSQGPVNIGTGVPVTIRQVVKEIADIVGRPDLPRFGALPTREDEPPEILADVTTLSSIGFQALHSRADGLRHTIEWWRDRKPLLE